MMKKIRVILALVFFLGISLLLTGLIPGLGKWLGWMPKLQFLPAVMAVNLAVIIGLVLLTFVFGRIYCSVICPLGVLQDGISKVSVLVKRARKNRKPFRFRKEHKWLRYGVWVLFVVFLLAGMQPIVALLAPYSAYGRINLETTKVGDRYVLEHMKEHDYNLGGEQSGHIIFLDRNTTGDGLLSALLLLQVVVDTGKPLSELASIMEVLPQALVNAKVPNHKKEHYLEYPEIAEAIEELNKKFAGEGRVLIRPSGTEPMVRVMIEGKDQKMIEEDARKLADLITHTML